MGNYRSIIDKAVANGNLVEILQRNWKLTTHRLTVSDVKYEEIRSKVQQKNAVNILAQRMSAIMGHSVPNNPEAVEMVSDIRLDAVNVQAIPIPQPIMAIA